MILTARGSQFMPRSPSDPTPSIPFYIYEFSKYAPGSDEIRMAWAAALVLVVVVILLNVGVRVVTGKREDPIVVGQILKPNVTKDDQRWRRPDRVSFFIAWWLDPESL